jgi:uncharacterized protein (DUF427 family)
MGAQRGLVRAERGAKRVRVYFGGVAIADTVRPLLVWEKPQYPAYYIPVEDVRTDLLVDDGEVRHSPSRGDAHVLTVKVGGEEAAGAALRYDESPLDDVAGHVRFDWNAMGGWFEEDEEVFTHPRNPYTRVDVLASSRHVRIELDGVTLAESSGARLLFETGLPVRFYLPKPHVRMDLLEPTSTETHCPYKGQAEYWSARVGDTLYKDLVWSYRSPFAEAQKVAGLVSFYDDKVDIFVDGQRWSREVQPSGVPA